MTDIRSMTLEELKEAMTALGEKPFRAKQIYEWLHVRLVDDFDEMTNLSRALREKLRENYALWPLQALRVQTAPVSPLSAQRSSRVLQIPQALYSLPVLHFPRVPCSPRA